MSTDGKMWYYFGVLREIGLPPDANQNETEYKDEHEQLHETDQPHRRVGETYPINASRHIEADWPRSPNGRGRDAEWTR